jgi:hypothetical protein
VVFWPSWQHKCELNLYARHINIASFIATRLYAYPSLKLSHYSKVTSLAWEGPYIISPDILLSPLQVSLRRRASRETPFARDLFLPPNSDYAPPEKVVRISLSPPDSDYASPEKVVKYLFLPIRLCVA